MLRKVENNSPAVRPPKSFGGEAQAGGQKGRGLGGRNFCPPASVPVPFEKRKSERGVWGEFRLARAEAKPRNGVRDKLRGGERKHTDLFRILFKESSNFFENTPLKRAKAGFAGKIGQLKLFFKCFYLLN